MIAFIDTNVLIDIITMREPWFKDSYEALHAILHDNLNQCMFPASAVTDVYYIVRKAAGRERAIQAVDKLSRLLTIADVHSVDIQTALNSPLRDYEDAVVEAVASRHDASLILTRNTADYSGSAVRAITPSEYIRAL